MTAPTPIRPGTVSPPHSVGWVTRLKLTEPVRLYCYTALLVLTAGLQLAGVLSGEWAEFTAANAAVLLGVGGAAEAARASVYSPASVVREMRRAAGAR